MRLGNCVCTLRVCEASAPSAAGSGQPRRGGLCLAAGLVALPGMRVGRSPARVAAGQRWSHAAPKKQGGVARRWWTAEIRLVPASTSVMGFLSCALARQA